VTQISVVICVYREDRWDSILAAVQSVRDQHLPAAETIIVVDHNPTLFARLNSTLSDAVVVENREKPGLSGGRNTGIASSHGEIVAFLDDDAIADPDWLMFLNDSYADPAVAGVGGLTIPKWETQRPPWFPQEFDWVIGCSYVGMPKSIGPVRNLLGGNASFRREVFNAVGGFRTGIGRSVSRLPLGCEETEFCIRLSQQSPGAVLLFDRRAVIWHLIPASRCRFSYFCLRCYAEGVSKSQVAASVGLSDGLSAERRYVSRTLPLGIVYGVKDMVHGNPSGLRRSGAILTGLAATVAGFAAGSLRRTRWIARSHDSATTARRVQNAR
jgi:glucosyl-dolichyl phosphate glucuronosyltransferase